MKLEEIDQLPAGPELDALIAEKVMGFKVTNLNGVPYTEWDGPDPKELPEYSAEIAAAWIVVDKLHLFKGRRSGDTEWGLCLQQNDRDEWVIKHRYGMDIVRAETAPLAICRAALKTVMVNQS